MKLLEIFTQLSHGELSNVALGGMNDDFGIREEDYEKVASHVNLGLLELHKRFQLHVDTVEIDQVEGSNTYVLGDDVLTIISAEDSDAEPVSINKVGSNYPKFNITTTNTGFKFEEGVLGKALFITYQATHPKIDAIGLDPALVEVDINPSVLQPLLYFVASRVYANVPALDGVSKSTEYMMKYEQACALVDLKGLTTRISFENNKLFDRGFV